MFTKEMIEDSLRKTGGIVDWFIGDDATDPDTFLDIVLDINPRTLTDKEKDVIYDILKEIESEHHEQITEYFEYERRALLQYGYGDSDCGTGTYTGD